MTTNTAMTTNTNKKTVKSNRHKCSMCYANLKGVKFSDHYCRTDIEIIGNGYIKKLLRADSTLRTSYPEVQHVWAELITEHSQHSQQQYRLKIKAPLDIIPEFLENLETMLHQQQQTQTQTLTQKKYNNKTCSFYNSPDGCTNEHCNREHIEDPEERTRLLLLKQIIDSSKILNEPIKSFYAHLDECEYQTRELNESIQRNFDRDPCLLQHPQIQGNITQLKKHYSYGYELEELRTTLKILSKQSYTNMNPQLLYQLQKTIQDTHQKVTEMEKHKLNENQVYDLAKEIYDKQYLSTCLYVV